MYYEVVLKVELFKVVKVKKSRKIAAISKHWGAVCGFGVCDLKIFLLMLTFVIMKFLFYFGWSYCTKAMTTTLREAGFKG